MWMIKKEMLLLWRHKPRLISLIIFPILMIGIFGYSMGGSVQNIPVVVVSQSNGPITDQTLNAIKDTKLYDVKDIITDPDKGKQMVQNGEAKAAIILPTDYENTNSSQPKAVTVYVDSSDQIVSQTLIPATQSIFSQISTQVGIAQLQTVGVTSSSLASFNPQNIMNSINLQIVKQYGDIRYIDFLVPAILAMTVMFSAMMGMGESIAGERERGELARLFMTPTSVATVVGGKILAKLTVETVRAIILIIVAIVLFGVVINGSIALTVLLLVLSVLCFVGFGIMISARVSTQEDYTQIVMPFTMPMMFLSGVFFPLETMPWIFQKIAYLFPLTYANDALRAVMLKGVGLGAIWVDVVVLLGFTVFFFGLGVTRFHRDV